MKKFLIVILLFPFSSFSQIPILPIDSTTNLITYTGVVKVQGNKDELYSRAREWFAKAYNSSLNVIQMDDKEKIVGKALMQVYFKALGKDQKSGYVNYTISIYFKDNKYKYEITNFYHSGQYNDDGNYISAMGSCEDMMAEKKKSYKKVYDYILYQVDENINNLIISLKEAMGKQATEKAKDW